jgi:hypothetical protein
MRATVARAALFFVREIIKGHQKVTRAPFGARFRRRRGRQRMVARRFAMKRLLALLALAPCATLAAEPAAVAYPEGFREWTHVKSMVIERGHPLFDAFGGIHHLYANKQALQGYRSGKFANGAVIVFDLL